MYVIKSVYKRIQGPTPNLRVAKQTNDESYGFNDSEYENGSIPTFSLIMNGVYVECVVSSSSSSLLLFLLLIYSPLILIYLASIFRIFGNIILHLIERVFTNIVTKLNKGNMYY